MYIIRVVANPSDPKEKKDFSDGESYAECVHGIAVVQDN
jgi:hypothetical protein